MGQVPQSTEKSILIIGNGKTARHLGFYFKNLNFKILHWHYRIDSMAALESLFEVCNYCFLLIKDDALNEFVDQNSFLKSSKSFHCSGSRSVPGLRCIHPLMTFSNELYETNFYQEIHWAIFEPNLKLSDYITELKNPWFYVPETKKTLYHALCVMSGNFTQILLSQVISQWQNELLLPDDSLKVYMQKVLENFWHSGSQAITGPLVRKDFGTIQKHLIAIQGHQAQLELYQAFLKIFLTPFEIGFCLNQPKSPQ